LFAALPDRQQHVGTSYLKIAMRQRDDFEWRMAIFSFKSTLLKIVIF